MRFTIENMDGSGEIDYTALLDPEAPPKIVRKLNRPSRLHASLVCLGLEPTAVAGSKVRLRRNDGGLWFSGYLVDAPRKFAGTAMGAPVFRLVLNAEGEQAALDRRVLSEHPAMGGYTAGEAIRVLTGEAAAGFDVSGVQDVAGGGTIQVQTGELWNTAAEQVANCARAALAAEEHALTLSPVGAVTRTLADRDAKFCPAGLQLKVSGPAANDITVIGGKEPALYVRDCFTANGTTKVFTFSQASYDLKSTILVEDDFRGSALDAAKWVNETAAALTFTPGGISCAGAAALRFRDLVEVGGTTILEQTGISYSSGQGVVGGLYSGGFGVEQCIVGVQLSGGQIQPVIDGEVKPSSGTLSANRLYEFRTIVFHPEPIRAGQVYASSVCHGTAARTCQVWTGTARVLLTMRTIDPADVSTASAPQMVIYDGTLENAPAYAEYLPLWASNLTCTLGQARALNCGAVWVQTAAPGQPWRTRVIGDVNAGAECYLTGRELHFPPASAPVLNEKIEVFYRTSRLACGRVANRESAQALANDEDDGTRAMVVHVTAPAPRTSLDCEQAARALLDDLTQPGCSGGYQSMLSLLPQSATDVQPGEQWNIDASWWGINCSVTVREVEIEFQNLCDANALFKLQFANDAAQIFSIRFERAKHNSLLAVVSSAQEENVSARPAGLPDARISSWSGTSLMVDTGVAPLPGGGFELRTEGDWGWGTGTNKNLVGRYTSQTFTLPFTGVTQAFYVRQFDGSTPPRYSSYSTVLNMEVQ